MILWRFILIFLWAIPFSQASECSGDENDLTTCWEKNLELFGNDLSKPQQSYCYIKEDGSIGGSNIDKPLVIASVSKIFTSLWAIQRSQLGPDHEFVTKFYTDGENLHIEGGHDPLFASRSLYAVVDKLNQLGIHKLKKVTFDEKFYFTPQSIDNPYYAQVYNKSSTHYCIPYQPIKGHLKDDLAYYLNTEEWETSLRVTSNASIPRGSTQCLNSKLTGESLLKDYTDKRKVFGYQTTHPKLIVSEVESSEANPFLENKNAKVIEYRSQKLGKLVKFINVNSANQPSDLLFYTLGGKDQFEKEFKTTLSENNNRSGFDFISGSGLSHKTKESGKWNVVSNKASCRTVLSILENFLKYTNRVFDPLFDPKTDRFQTSAETRYKNIAKMYMAVSGVEGTVHKRYQSEFPQSFVGKTGTLGNGSSLVGTMKTKKGLRHFVIINNYTNQNYRKKANTARNLQYEMVKDMFGVLGKSQFQYQPTQKLTKESFKPYQSVEVVQ